MQWVICNPSCHLSHAWRLATDISQRRTQRLHNQIGRRIHAIECLLAIKATLGFVPLSGGP